ncbi:ATP-dependent RNA helicase vasa-like, partial [Anopheles cruzii]|uniref:ATP-dependent RNA helicase vasa-like n=1 Tax=Anopheles cruzii TaxID=68878 RepID=UPI0022EC8385
MSDLEWEEETAGEDGLSFGNAQFEHQENDNAAYRGNRGAARGSGGNEKQQNEVPREVYIPPPPSEDEKEIFGSGISSGINFENLNDIEVSVSGEDPPNPLQSFEASGLSETLLINIRKSGYKKPTPIQRHGIPVVLAGRDLMACAQTGSGKTAAFMLPMIDRLLEMDLDMRSRNPYVLIVAPTRELAIQIRDEGRKFAHDPSGVKLKVCILYGGADWRSQMNFINGGCQILVATPGRLIDIIDRGWVNFENVKFVVLDEADRMLDMGFLPSIEKIMSHSTMAPKEDRQTLMFSATFPREIQELAGNFLSNYIYIAVGIVGAACSDVQQEVYEVGKFDKRQKLEEILGSEDPIGTLVFVETKRNADYLATFMSETQFKATSIHGDRLQREREQALSQFRTGRMKVLIATSVAARGLDMKSVRHVINYDMPTRIDDYVHRIGRTGRVGNKGRATSFYDPSADSAIANDLVKILKQAGQPVPGFLEGFGGSDGFGPFDGSTSFGGRDIRDS